MATQEQKIKIKERNLKKLKDLHNTISTIANCRKIQKEKVDNNVLSEELTQEEIDKFHKPMNTQLSILNETMNEQKSSLNAIVPAIEGLKESNVTPAITS